MKKLVIKTIIITLISFIVAIALAFGILTLCAPGFLGDIFDGAGNKNASVFFYEKQYSKTGDIDDLNTLVLKIDVENDSDRAEKYYKIILEHGDFDALIENQNLQNRIAPKDFYVSQYVLSLAINGKFSSAVDYAKNYTQSTYSQDNPFRVLIYDFIDEDMNTEIKLLSSTLSTLNITDSDDLAILNGDRAYLTNLVNN